MKTAFALACVTTAVTAAGQSAFAASSPKTSISAHQVASASASVELDPDAGAQLQQTLETVQQAVQAPGAAATIMQDGHVLWSGYSGLAISEDNVPVGPSTLFSLASITKMYTATLIMKLVEEGRLQLDEPIAGLVPSYIPDTSSVTVRDLLAMTSGYKDVEGSAAFYRWSRDPNYPWTQEAVFRLIGPLNRRPGTSYFYNNTNFLLLDRIVEEVTHVSFATDLDQLIVQPLGLQNTFVTLNPTVTQNIAHGYEQHRGGRLKDYSAGASDGVPTDVFGPIWGDGGIATNSTDLATFIGALYSGEILEPATITEMELPQPGGSPGLATLTHRAHGIVWDGHDGGYGGFSSEGWYDPARHLTIVTLANALPVTSHVIPARAIWRRMMQTYERVSATATLGH